MVATTGQAQIQARAELGETAIRLLAALGVSAAQLEAMAGIEEPGEMVAKLRESHNPPAPVKPRVQLELPLCGSAENRSQP